MDDEDDQLWNFSLGEPLLPLPMEELLHPPLPAEDLLQPPVSLSSYQEPFIGELQVDGSHDDTDGGQDADGAAGGVKVEESSEGVPESSMVLGDDDDGNEEEPPEKKFRPIIGHDFPDYGIPTLENIASSSQDSGSTSHTPIPSNDFYNLNVTFNNSGHYDNIISEFGNDIDDEELVIMAKTEKMSDDTSSDEEQGNNEAVVDEDSQSGGRKDFTQGLIPGEDDLAVDDEVDVDASKDGGDGGMDGDGDEDYWEYDSDEIDAMLDENLAQRAPKRKRPDENSQQEGQKEEGLPEESFVIVRNKTVLKGKSQIVFKLCLLYLETFFKLHYAMVFSF